MIMNRLYGTKGCHLCDLAEQLLTQMELPYDYIDIADDEKLMEKYGVRIPVIYCTINNKELGWPFDEQSLMSLGLN